MANQTQTRRILIKIDSGDSKGQLSEIATRMGALNKTTKSLAGNMGFLTNALRGWIGFLGVREIVSMSDSMQNLQSRLRLVTSNAEEAKAAFTGISEVANRTSTSIADTGQTFTRFANALKGTGATSKELLAFTETLTNSFRVAGTTNEETANSIIQLSQAFSKGKLDGDEFRTVMENNVVLAQALKREYGSDIYKKSKEGAIGITEVLRILAKNQQQINDDAKKLAPTFEQTLTKSMNVLRVSIGRLNEQYELSAKFAKVMELAMNNLAETLTVLGGVIAVMAIRNIPNMVAGLASLRAGFTGLTASNPVLLALAGFATVTALISENLEGVVRIVAKAEAAFYDLAAALQGVGYSVNSFLNDKLGINLSGALESNIKNIEKFKNSAAKIRSDLARDDELTALVEKSKGGKKDDIQSLLESLASKAPKAKEKAQSLKGELSELNKAFLDGRLSLGQYNQKLIDFEIYKVTRQFREGKTDIFKFHEELAKLDAQSIARQFNSGAISLNQFNQAVANVRLSVLNEQLRAGKIGLAEYNEELIKLEDRVRPGAAMYTGIADFIKSAGTLSQGIAKVTSQAFDHLAETLTTFIKTGKFQFADFTRAILDDLTAMLVRAAIVRPIAQGLLGAIGGAAISGAAGGVSADFGTGTTSFAGYAANGGVMTPQGFAPLNTYANGGIARSPQMAIFGEGRTPEAYVPLPDGRNIPVKMDGASGVTISQVININSDGSSSVDSRETGENAKQLGNLISQKVAEEVIKMQRPGGRLARNG